LTVRRCGEAAVVAGSKWGQRGRSPEKEMRRSEAVRIVGAGRGGDTVLGGGEREEEDDAPVPC
jgi:hypothetical protein